MKGPNCGAGATADRAGVEAVAALQRAALQLVEVIDDNPADLPARGPALVAEVARRLPAAAAAIRATPADWAARPVRPGER